MTVSTEIGLADLLRAFDQLRPDPNTAALVARVLGYAAADPNPTEATRGVSQEAEAGERRFRSGEGADRPLPAIPRAVRPEPPPPLPRERLAIRLTRIASVAEGDRASRAAPPEIVDAPPLAERLPVAPREPLFHERAAPHLLSAAASTRRPGPELDLEATLRMLVSARPLRRLPRRPIATLERGVQLLLDYASAMDPFREDLKDLARKFHDVVGPGRCAVFRFERDPRAAARGPWRDSPRWLPRRGTPAVVATDFGRSVPARTPDSSLLRAWDDFLGRCAEADCPVVVLDPLGPAFWPRNLSRRLTLIHWSPATRATAIRHLVGPGHELRETRDPPAPEYLTEALRLRPRAVRDAGKPMASFVERPGEAGD